MEVTSKPAELERLDRKILQPLGFFLRHLLLGDPLGELGIFSGFLEFSLLGFRILGIRVLEVWA